MGIEIVCLLGDVIHMKESSRGEHIENTVSVAVLGGGHAGRGLAAYLARRGLNVSLFNRTFENIAAIAKHGGLDVSGVVNGFAPITTVTDDVAEAILGRDILIVTVPAHAHRFYAESMAPFLEPGQLVLLMPGRTGGALEFAQVIGCLLETGDIMLGEAQTFTFVSRTTGPSSVKVSEVKNSVRVSAFPATFNGLFLRRLREIPLILEAASDVLETSLNNIGAMLHPAPTILSAGLLESRSGGYDHYIEGISQSVGRLIEKMDAERMAVASRFTRSPVSLIQWLKDSYNASGTSLYECIQTVDAYVGVGSPSTLQHRYVLEDIPTGLVPISYFGKIAGVQTPAIDSIVEIACQLYDIDFWTIGRNPHSLGLVGMTTDEIKEYVAGGFGFSDEVSVDEPVDIYEMEMNRW